MVVTAVTSQKPSIELQSINSPAINNERWSVYEGALAAGRIQRTEDLQAIVEAAPPRSVVLFRRSNCCADFLKQIAHQSGKDTFFDDVALARTHWYPISRNSADTGLPHVHSQGVFHFSPFPSTVPTALISLESCVQVLLRMSESGLPSETFAPAEASRIMEVLRTSAQKLDSPKGRAVMIDDLFFHARLCADSPRGRSNSSSSTTEYYRHLAQHLQCEIKRVGGLDEVGLGDSQYVGVYLPPGVLHARSMLNTLSREHDSAWLYYDRVGRGDQLVIPPARLGE